MPIDVKGMSVDSRRLVHSVSTQMSALEARRSAVRRKRKVANGTRGKNKNRLTDLEFSFNEREYTQMYEDLLEEFQRGYLYGFGAKENNIEVYKRTKAKLRKRVAMAHAMWMAYQKVCGQALCGCVEVSMEAKEPGSSRVSEINYGEHHINALSKDINMWLFAEYLPTAKPDYLGGDDLPF